MRAVCQPAVRQHALGVVVEGLALDGWDQPELAVEAAVHPRREEITMAYQYPPVV
jgi:hypothetical protein